MATLCPVAGYRGGAGSVNRRRSVSGRGALAASGRMQSPSEAPVRLLGVVPITFVYASG